MAGKYKYLTFEDRQKIEVWHACGDRPLEMAARLKRVFRDLDKNKLQTVESLIKNAALVDVPLEEQ